MRWKRHQSTTSVRAERVRSGLEKLQLRVRWKFLPSLFPKKSDLDRKTSRWLWLDDGGVKENAPFWSPWIAGNVKDALPGSCCGEWRWQGSSVRWAVALAPCSAGPTWRKWRPTRGQPRFGGFVNDKNQLRWYGPQRPSWNNADLVELKNVQELEEFTVLLVVLELDVVLLEAVQGQLRFVVDVHFHRLQVGRRKRLIVNTLWRSHTVKSPKRLHRPPGTAATERKTPPPSPSSSRLPKSQSRHIR